MKDTVLAFCTTFEITPDLVQVKYKFENKGLIIIIGAFDNEIDLTNTVLGYP